MKKSIKGSITVEAAVIVPLIFVIFSISLHILFYYHDKNILLSVTHETLSVGCAREKTEKEELEEYFHLRVQGKLLLLTNVQSIVEVTKDEVQLWCTACKGKQTCNIESTMKKTAPENYIREVQKIIKIQEGIGQQN